MSAVCSAAGLPQNTILPTAHDAIDVFMLLEVLLAFTHFTAFNPLQITVATKVGSAVMIFSGLCGGVWRHMVLWVESNVRRIKLQVYLACPA